MFRNPISSLRVTSVPLTTWLWHLDQQQGTLLKLSVLVILKGNGQELKPVWDFPRSSLPHKVKSQSRDRVLWVREDLEPLFCQLQPSSPRGPRDADQRGDGSCVRRVGVLGTSHT